MEDDDLLTSYVYENFTVHKSLEDQVAEVVELADVTPLKETVWGKRKHQYWSHQELQFLHSKFEHHPNWSKQEQIQLAKELGVDLHKVYKWNYDMKKRVVL